MLSFIPARVKYQCVHWTRSALLRRRINIRQLVDLGGLIIGHNSSLIAQKACIGYYIVKQV